MKKGFIFAVMSAFTFSIMNLLVKFLGNYQAALALPSSEIAFFRGLFGTVAVLLLMYWRNISFSRQDRGLLLMRGIYGGVAMLCNFMALVYLKMSDAAILFQLSGVFVFIFSTIFLNEKLPQGSGKWLIIIFIAVIVLVNPFDYSASFGLPAFIAIAGAALSAAAYATIRSIGRRGNHNPFELIAYFMIAGMITGVIGMFSFQSFVMPDLTQWGYITAIGLISLVGQYFLTGAFVTTNAVIAQFLQYIGIFFSAFWGFIIFDETLSMTTVFAGILMFMASIMLSRLKQEQNKK